MSMDPVNVTQGTEVLEVLENGLKLKLPKDGGGILMPELAVRKERYVSFYVKVLEEHSMAFQLNLYDAGKEEPTFRLRTGLLPNVKSFIMIDTELLHGQILFPEPVAGSLKMVCHGSRIKRETIARTELVSMPCHHDITIEISDMAYTAEYPSQQPLDDVIMVDRFGQNAQRDWPEKVRSEEELKALLTAQYDRVKEGYPFANWSKWGGALDMKLKEGTGFFSSIKKDGRWWLTDPDGNAFFSFGCDCVRPFSDSRVDGAQKWLEEIPDPDGPYGQFYEYGKWRETDPRDMVIYNFMAANLYRVFGDDWKECWQKMCAGMLRENGFNTIGNWSDEALYGTCGVPYVSRLPEFPSTKINIFRDFPDVLSEEYAENAALLAEGLRGLKDDPWQIGYFLRNEPAWAFVDDLIIADEVLYNEEMTVCKAELIRTLEEKYGTVEALNAAWSTEFKNFDDLKQHQEKASAYSAQAEKDLKEFSVRMVRAYVEIPSKACRKVDPNHMILGMRWAWISDPDLTAGWENFDVFSINCYAVDPTESVQHVADLGVDLPVMIGEFHFGALDKGLTATGLEAVRTQKERGIAIRYYFEKVAAHPYGVGAHYFQCNDQFLLGRFDGENYNIGVFDICCQPYTEMTEHIVASAEHIYEVAAGMKAPVEEAAESIPMIAY